MSRRSRDAILNDALLLSADDRVRIAQRLFESVHEEVDPDVESAWLKEIERRIEALDRSDAKRIPADEVREACNRALRPLRDAG